MARTLPWLKHAPAATTTSLTSHSQSSNKPAKRPRLLSPSPSRSSSPNPKHHRSPVRSMAGRSPSTSPPPAPPTAEAMRSGLDADDIYIMVEDEFLSVARTFTAHLHHAEYVRLKNEARNRNASTINNISRPVDGRTTMRTETRKKKEAEELDARLRKGLEGMVSSKRARMEKQNENGLLSESESDFDPSEGQEAPWQGTQLSKFMVKSPRKAVTGLIGLQGVTANTRAAAGYERSEKKDRASPTPRGSRVERNEVLASIADELASEDDDKDEDDDLDAPSRATSRALPPSLRPPTKPELNTKATLHPTRPITNPKTTALSPSTKPRPPPKRSFLDLSPLPRASASTSKPATTATTKISNENPPIFQRNLALSDDEYLPSAVSREEILARRRHVKARKEKAMDAERANGGGVKADEIPIFLV